MTYGASKSSKQFFAGFIIEGTVLLGGVIEKLKSKTETRTKKKIPKESTLRKNYLSQVYEDVSVET